MMYIIPGVYNGVRQQERTDPPAERGPNGCSGAALGDLLAGEELGLARVVERDVGRGAIEVVVLAPAYAMGGGGGGAQ
jgi:hypothetical protein